MTRESAQQLRKRIEQLHARLWSDPDERAELETMIDDLKARLRHLEQAGPR
jgi:uncharacterized coiled-coil DUF342 family protein